MDGCGRSAFYQCMANHYERGRSFTERLVDHAVDPEDCILVHTRKAAPRTAPLVARQMSKSYGPLLKSTLSAASVNITAVALPEHDGNHIWLRLKRRSGRFDPEGLADVRMYRDGTPLAVSQVQVLDAHHLVLCVEATDLREVHTALKLSAKVQDLQVTLGDKALRALSLLEVELREQRGEPGRTASTVSPAAKRRATP